MTERSREPRVILLSEYEALFLSREALLARWRGASTNPTDSLAKVLYRDYGASGIPWADLEEWKRDAWRAETEDLLDALGIEHEQRSLEDPPEPVE